MEIGFSLGSNLGDRLAHFIEAKKRLLAVPGTKACAQSSLYETEPVGVGEDYRDLLFLNAVLVVESPLSAHQWLAEAGAIEDALGRIRTDDRNAPRPIDIDILYAGDLYVDDGGLMVPHPRWTQRRFVVEPLAEVRPNLVLPGEGQTVREVLAGLGPSEGITRLPEAW